MRCGAGGHRGLSASVPSFFSFFLVYFSSVVVVAIVFSLSFGIVSGKGEGDSIVLRIRRVFGLVFVFCCVRQLSQLVLFRISIFIG